MEDQISNLQPTKVIIHGKELFIRYKLYMTIIDALLVSSDPVISSLLCSLKKEPFDFLKTLGLLTLLAI
jgi:hypothetical protein